MKEKVSFDIKLCNFSGPANAITFLEVVSLQYLARNIII